MIGTPPVVVTPTDDSAARRTVARAMRLGLYIWPTFTALDVFMCFVAYPDAPFGLFSSIRRRSMKLFRRPQCLCVMHR